MNFHGVHNLADAIDLFDRFLCKLLKKIAANATAKKDNPALLYTANSAKLGIRRRGKCPVSRFFD